MFQNAAQPHLDTHNFTFSLSFQVTFVQAVTGDLIAGPIKGRTYQGGKQLERARESLDILLDDHSIYLRIRTQLPLVWAG